MEITQKILKDHLNYIDGNLYWSDFSIRPNAKKTAIGNLMPNGYLQMKLFSKHMYVHRVIFLYHHGYLPKFVDHINGKKSDNMIENLRDVNRFQNMMNVKKTSQNKSGYKGVSYNKKMKKWVAQIKCNKEHFYLGTYETAELAYKVYCAKANELHGEFANFG